MVWFGFIIKEYGYSSHPAANETLLEIIETRQTSKDNALGEMLETIFQWRIPKTEITFNTSLWEYPENAWLGFELNFPTEISPTATEGLIRPLCNFLCLKMQVLINVFSHIGMEHSALR